MMMFDYFLKNTSHPMIKTGRLSTHNRSTAVLPMTDDENRVTATERSSPSDRCCSLPPHLVVHQ